MSSSGRNTALTTALVVPSTASCSVNCGHTLIQPPVVAAVNLHQHPQPTEAACSCCATARLCLGLALPGRVHIRGMDAQIGFADALRRIFPTALASSPISRWVRHETLHDRMSVTFLREATGRQD